MLEQKSSSLENYLVPQSNEEFFGPPCSNGVQIMVNHGDHTEKWTGLLLAPTPSLIKPTTHFSPLNPHLGSLNPSIGSFSRCDNINRISFLFFTIICLLIDGKDSRACACPGFPSKSSGYMVIVECHFSGPISCWVCLLFFQALLHIFFGRDLYYTGDFHPILLTRQRNNVLPNLCILEPVVNH